VTSIQNKELLSSGIEKNLYKEVFFYPDGSWSDTEKKGHVIRMAFMKDHFPGPEEIEPMLDGVERIMEIKGEGMIDG
jgi:hypothetical protein